MDLQMTNFINRKIARWKAKHSQNEYGFKKKSFDLTRDGIVEYAQWLHPLEQPKEITQGMVNFFRKYSTEGSLVLDIGAHTGDTSVPIALAVGVTGTVLAFEPNPYVFKILQQNANLNKSNTNIIPLDFAATDADGEFEFNYSDASFCNGGFFQRIQNQKHGHNYVLKVKGKNIENFLTANYSAELNSLSLIKVDAEGYDKEILKTLKPILARYKPNIISECNKNLTEEERTDLFEVIHGLDYDLFKMDGFDEGGSLTAIAVPSDMNNWKHFDIVAVKRDSI
jgi:FkbM family methyltransferase